MFKKIFALLVCFTFCLSSQLLAAKTEGNSTVVGGQVIYGHDTATTIQPVKIRPDGSVEVTTSSTPFAQKITQPDASSSYFAVAAVGTAQATASWQAYKMTTTGTSTTITWADGNANFDNVATDLTALTYS